MKHAPLLARLLRFAAVGAVGTGAHYLLMVALVEILASPPLLASVGGFLTGALVNYSLSRRLVFASARAHVQALPRFMLVAGSGLLLNTGLMALFTGPLGWHYLLAQVLATALLLFWHYAGNALWTFGR